MRWHARTSFSFATTVRRSSSLGTSASVVGPASFVVASSPSVQDSRVPFSHAMYSPKPLPSFFVFCGAHLRHAGPQGSAPREARTARATLACRYCALAANHLACRARMRVSATASTLPHARTGHLEAQVRKPHDLGILARLMRARRVRGGGCGRTLPPRCTHLHACRRILVHDRSLGGNACKQGVAHAALGALLVEALLRLRQAQLLQLRPPIMPAVSVTDATTMPLHEPWSTHPGSGRRSARQCPQWRDTHGRAGDRTAPRQSAPRVRVSALRPSEQRSCPLYLKMLRGLSDALLRGAVCFRPSLALQRGNVEQHARALKRQRGHGCGMRASTAPDYSARLHRGGGGHVLVFFFVVNASDHEMYSAI